MTRNKICLILLSFLFFSFNTVCAQQISQLQERQLGTTVSNEQLWQNGINDLRAIIKKLIEENKAYRNKYQSLESQAKQFEDLLKSSEQEKLQALEKPGELEKQVKELQTKFLDLQSENESLQKKVKALTKEKESLWKKDADVENQIKLLENTIKELEQEKQVSIKGNKAELDRLKKIEYLFKESEKGNLNLSQKVPDLNKLLKENQEQVSILNKDKALLTAELTKIKEERERLQSRAAVSIQKTSDVAAEKEKNTALLESQIVSLKASNEELKSSLEEIKRQKSILLAESPNPMQADAVALNTQIMILQDQNLVLEKDIADLKGSLDEAQEKMSQLTREKIILESMLELQLKQPVVTSLSTSGITTTETLAYNLARQGKYQEAIKKYKEILKLNPRNKNIHYNLGCVYTKLGDYKDALEEFELVLKNDPNDKQTHYNLSKIYEYLGDNPKAESHYSTYLNLK